MYIIQFSAKCEVSCKFKLSLARRALTVGRTEETKSNTNNGLQMNWLLFYFGSEISFKAMFVIQISRKASALSSFLFHKFGGIKFL